MAADAVHVVAAFLSSKSVNGIASVKICVVLV